MFYFEAHTLNVLLSNLNRASYLTKTGLRVREDEVKGTNESWKNLRGNGFWHIVRVLEILLNR